MMSRITELFTHKKEGVLNIYVTAGYPNLHSTLPIIKALEKSGADLVELGMPYSDPLADGPVIQASGNAALANGMSIEELFRQLDSLRVSVKLPVILMGYMNPVLQFGFERFCAEAARVGIDGLILPDLPEYEYETEFGPIIAKYGLDLIFLVTPETSEERIRKLDKLSRGFLYAVSSSSTTGSDTDQSAVGKYLQRLRGMKLTNPILVGFGIKDKASFRQACQYANGAIIGTAFIKAVEGAKDEIDSTEKFVRSILD